MVHWNKNDSLQTLESYLLQLSLVLLIPFYLIKGRSKTAKVFPIIISSSLTRTQFIESVLFIGKARTPARKSVAYSD